MASKPKYTVVPVNQDPEAGAPASAGRGGGGGGGAPAEAPAPKPFQVTAWPPARVLWNPFAWLFWGLDFGIWSLTLVGPVSWFLSCFTGRGAKSVQAKGAWRRSECKDGLCSRHALAPDCRTTHELLQVAVSKYAENPACGTRLYLGQHKLEGQRFPLQKFGATSWITYRDFGKRFASFGSGLLQLGMRPAPAGLDLQHSNGPHVLLIYEETCMDWMTACFGAFTQSIAVATSYATLGISAVAEAVKETHARAILCNVSEVEKVAAYCAGKCPSLQVIIYTTNNSLVAKPEPSASLKNFKVCSVAEVMELGAKDIEFHAPEPEHLAVIMYTSGSTGKPKGVMIKHGSLMASVAALGDKFIEFGLQPGKSNYLAYLPAAHIMELVGEIQCFCMGCAVGYADPKTISSKGACRQTPDGSIRTAPGYPHPPGGIQEFKPHLMAAVPKIWDILKKGVEEVVGKGSPVKQWLFQVAYTGRYWALNQGRDSPLFNLLIFNKMSAMLGGQMKVGMSGGGPISADVQTFIRVAFGLPLYQGYALTETACAGAIQAQTDHRTGVVGGPLISVEIQLRSCLDGKGEPEVMDRHQKPYLDKDRDHYGAPCMGRGEVLIRGPSVSSGYFQQPKKTEEVFDADGWFHTGDVGVMTPDGALMIVDRLKNLVKLKGGEYIAIEAMEKEYSTSPYVNGANGGILCYGDGDLDRPVALVQANTAELERWAKGAGVAYASVEALCANPAAAKVVLDSMVAAGKKGGLAANEILAGVALIPGTGSPEGPGSATSPWTPQNGGLTASNKLNRQTIQQFCAELLVPLKAKGIR